jgi:molybdopterin/thiamine biosynthesis adenylyltransferase
MNVILDGTDNFETRYLINDFAVREKIPWVYGAAVGSTGTTMTIIPAWPAAPAHTPRSDKCCRTKPSESPHLWGSVCD